MSNKLKGIDRDEVVDILRDLNSNASMNNGGLSLWYNKIKSKNLAEIERNVNDAFNSRVSSVERFMDICLKLATFDARVKHELAQYVHSINMMTLQERREAIALAREEIETRMLAMDVGLASLDYKLKKAILAKANHNYDDDEEDADLEIVEDHWEDQWGV